MLLRSLSCIVLLTFIGLVCPASQAQPKFKPKPFETSILYSTSLPGFAKGMMPARSRSLFWGKLLAKTSSPEEIGLHLYAAYAPELENEWENELHLVLDVLALKPKARLINRTFLVYRSSWAPTQYGISFAWLDQKRQTIPLLVVKSFSKGVYGPIGVEYFVVFPDGWSKFAGVSDFIFGRWFASNSDGQDNELTVGDDNLLGIHSTVISPAGEVSSEDFERRNSFDSKWHFGSKKFLPTTKENASKIPEK